MRGSELSYIRYGYFEKYSNNNWSTVEESINGEYEFFYKCSCI